MHFKHQLSPPKKRYTFLLLLCVAIELHAQLPDIFRLEYSFLPKTRSEDRYTRFRLALNYPFKLKKDQYLIVGAEYNRILLELEEDYGFNTADLDKIHVIDLNLNYIRKLSEHWRFGINFNPRIASTLNTSITQDDIFFNGGVFFVKDGNKTNLSQKPYRLVLGLTYNATTGIPFPLPFVSYYTELNDKWNYNLGIPRSNLTYNLDNRQRIQFFAALDGYFAHLQGATIVNNQIAQFISLSVAVGGVGYKYEFTDHLEAYSYIGYTFRLNNVIRDKDRKEIFKLDNLNSFYLRTGIKFKI